MRKRSLAARGLEEERASVEAATSLTAIRVDAGCPDQSELRSAGR